MKKPLPPEEGGSGRSKGWEGNDDLYRELPPRRRGKRRRHVAFLISLL
jgi:hypothetical protein